MAAHEPKLQHMLDRTRLNDVGLEDTPTLPIGDIKVDLPMRFRKDLGDIETLAESTKSVGLLHPIVVNEGLELIAGFRRLEACRRLGWSKVPARIVPLKYLMRGELHENAVRKDFAASEMVAIKRHFEPKIAAEAKKRQEATQLIDKGTPGERKFPTPEKGRTRDIIAKYVGVSERTLEKAEAIVEAASPSCTLDS